MVDLEKLGKAARQAARRMATIGDQQKNDFLHQLAIYLNSRSTEILAANQLDIEAAAQAGLSSALLDRLMLNQQRLDSIAADLESLAEMPDLTGTLIDERDLPSGIHAQRVRVPLGVIAVIYEARPNVTVDISALGLKAGNAVILRGGKETIRTNQSLVNIIGDTLAACGLPREAVQFIDDPDRELVNHLVRMDDVIDMLIPRGGNALQEFCKKEASMPVMLGGIGICHLFVDRSADLSRVVEVVFNAKVQRPSVCNALDTLLVHTQVASQLIPAVVARLRPAGVSFRLDESAQSYLKLDAENGIEAALPGDFDREWLSLVLGIRVVDSMQSAIDHIWEHSTFHSDGILTEDEENARAFVQAVDSAVVYVNASTRFSDGAQLGLGGEVAVSTQRMHARGPIGLEGLTTYKWVIQGDYTVRK